jgi:bifunctional ADP-heptose synthase (sugar kinase/adenylyltransferase)
VEKNSFGKPLPRFNDFSHLKMSIDEIHRFLEDAKKLKVCLIGDSIVDDWRYLKLHSISQKSKCMSGEEIIKKQQIGGAGIIAMHLSSFVKSIDFYTNKCSFWEDINNINFKKINDGELIKTRFLNLDDEKVLFESKRLFVNKNKHKNYLNRVNFKKYDAILVADFGHDLVNEKVKSIINKHCPTTKLACMAQANSSNFGFNLPIKFTKAAYYCMNKVEAELSIQRKNISDTDLFHYIENLLRAESFAITMGANGAIIKVNKDKYKIPTVSEVIVDDIGCGDAFFALSSLAVLKLFPANICALLGSIGAAIMSQKHCNESPVTLDEMLKLVDIIL